MNLPLIKREAALKTDHKKMEQIQMATQLAEEFIINKKIRNLPKVGDFNDKNNTEKMLIEGNIMSGYMAIQLLSMLIESYYTGEYVPKDDYQVFRYLRKIVEFTQYSNSPGSDELVFSMNPSSNNNPLHFTKLAIEAGSLGAEAMLVSIDLNRPECLSYALPRLEDLANQGSPRALNTLAEFYKYLSESEPDMYAQKAEYWHKKAIANLADDS